MTNSTEQSPSEAGSRSAGRDVPLILWDTTVHCCVRQSPSLDPTLSQLNPVYTLTSCFFKIRFNIHLLLWLPCGLLPSNFPTGISYAHLICPSECHIWCACQPRWFDHVDDNWWKVKIVDSLCNTLHPPVTFVSYARILFSGLYSQIVKKSVNSPLTVHRSHLRNHKVENVSQ
jgi:hypothetical protein